MVGFIESMTYGMPGYRRPSGEIEVGFASQKQYVSLYILRTDVVSEHCEALRGSPVGKGCTRFRRPEQVDRELVRSLLRATAAVPGPVC